MHFHDNSQPVRQQGGIINADFHSISLLGYEAESDFHSLQQMDAKITDVPKELKLKYREERITEDQICPK